MKKFLVLVCALVTVFATVPTLSLAKDGGGEVVSQVVATININVASAEELQSLPGIGKVTAARIIEHREQSGGFTSVDQLVQVKGIGNKTLEKIRDLISVE